LLTKRQKVTTLCAKIWISDSLSQQTRLATTFFPRSTKSVLKINMFSRWKVFFNHKAERDEFLRGLQFTRIKKTVIKIKTLIVHNYLVLINNIFLAFLKPDFPYWNKSMDESKERTFYKTNIRTFWSGNGKFIITAYNLNIFNSNYQMCNFVQDKDMLALRNNMRQRGNKIHLNF